MDKSIKPPWFVKLEQDAEARKAEARLRLAIEEDSKKPTPNRDHDWSDCIGTWNRGEERLKGTRQ